MISAPNTLKCVEGGMMSMIMLALIIGLSPVGGESAVKLVPSKARVHKRQMPLKVVMEKGERLTPEIWFRFHPEDRDKSPPWSDDIQTPPWNYAENYTSMAVDATGKIVIGFNLQINANTYAWGLKWSTDFGVTWNDAAWWFGQSGTGFHFPEIAITDDGKYYLFGSRTGPGYSYNACFAFTSTNNDPNSCGNVITFTTLTDHYYPEAVTYGNSNQFVIASYTRETTGSDSVSCLYNHDGSNNSSWLQMWFTFDTELGYTSIGVNVVGGIDTILIHGFDEFASGDWNVYGMLDTLNGSGTTYYWWTTNTNPDVAPRVFFSQNYAYIAYQSDVGGGNYDIMFRYSTDNGSTWGDIVDITNDAGSETYCRLSGDAEKIGCVYIYGGNNLRFLYSYDNGQNWSNYEQVNDNGSNSVVNEYSSASLLYTSGRWYASWTDNRDGNNNIYASYRDMGQGDITHRPDELLFDYTSEAQGPPPEKIVSFHPTHKIDPKLKDHLASVAKNDFVPIIILLSSKVNHEWLLYQVRDMDRMSRREFVLNELRKYQKVSQGQLLSFLREEKMRGNVRRIVPIMVGNAVYAEVKPDVIKELETRPDVGQIGLDEPLQKIGMVKDDSYFNLARWIPQPTSIEWGVRKINAPQVWALGYTGAGVVVAHLDSGCDYTHPDLADHLWDGTPHGLPNHGYDFVDNDNDPMDEDGHGTNTAGIIAGDGTSGDTTGVAPDAQLMILRIYPGGTAQMGPAIDSALSWGADLLSTSIGWRDPNNTLKDWNRNKCNDIYAAGLVYSTAAGNEGYTNWPNAIIAPACVPPPKPLTPGGGRSSAIALAATNSGDAVAAWSSRGPTEWNTSNYNDYPYPPGLLKPDLAAPGVNVRSTALGGGYSGLISGTSYAQPHFAGMVALMLQREPLLNPDAIDSIAKMTAVDIEAIGDDSLSGSGRIDALAAVQAISEGVKQGTFWVINQATATGLLKVDSITQAQNKPWILYVNPTSFTVQIDDSQQVTVQTDTTGAGCVAGANWDTLLIWSNSVFDDNPERVPVQLLYPGIGVEEMSSLQLKGGISILARPNPLHLDAEIEFLLPYQSKVALSLYDQTGRKVRTLIDKEMVAGLHRIRWKGDDDRNRPLPAGIYFLILEDGREIKSQKLVIIR